MALQDFFMGTPQQTIDPYAQSRPQTNQLLGDAVGSYNQMQQRPYLDPEMMKYLDTAAEEKVRNQSPQAGRSGYLDQKVWDAQLQNRLATLDRAMKERGDMRNYIAALSGQQGQMRTDTIAKQPGQLENAAGAMFQQGMGGLGDAAGKMINNIDFSKIFGGSPQGGMGVQPRQPNPAGQTSNGWETP
jgi:hypothetical protein